jgi:hypothetical protein
MFRSSGEVLPQTGPREAYKTVCLKELVVFLPCEESFRKSSQKINRVLWRGEEDEIQSRTMANVVEREGEQIGQYRDQQAKEILTKHGFSQEGKRLDEQKAEIETAGKSALSAQTIQKAIEELNQDQAKEQCIKLEELQETFEDPQTVKANISLDDVCSKKQKASGREKGSPSKEKREFLSNTVAHIQSGEGKSYRLNTACLFQMTIWILAFLLDNRLLSKSGPLVFFVDGAVELRLAIGRVFGFLPFKIILDWYHLEKKCQERLSQALKGKQIRNQVLPKLLALLWRGKIDLAISYLRALDHDWIKNADQIEKLIGYFERNRPFLCCYALRQKLGLRISSNPVEKANDLLVSDRQKHNGMSWSSSGSCSLATVTCLRLNAEHLSWLRHRTIPFSFDHQLAA